jgi:hypothetical protein
MIKIKVRTLFDITATGVIGHFKNSRIPFKDQAGHNIVDVDTWTRARNQQRNWETLTQLIQLRTQIIDLQNPQVDKDIWSFEFTTETEVFNDGVDPVGVLKQDSADVPMLCDLDNNPDIDSVLVVTGTRQNIWFSAEAINTILEN